MVTKSAPISSNRSIGMESESKSKGNKKITARFVGRKLPSDNSLSMSWTSPLCFEVQAKNISLPEKKCVYLVLHAIFNRLIVSFLLL